jgi:hypothetical protein
MRGGTCTSMRNRSGGAGSLTKHSLVMGFVNTPTAIRARIQDLVVFYPEWEYPLKD